MNSDNEIRRRRLEFDRKVVSEIARQSRWIHVEAYADQADFKRRRNRIIRSSDGRSALHYLVRYDLRSLVGPGTYHAGFAVHFDLESEGTYPVRSAEAGVSAGGILATCVSSPVPWSPHFLVGFGTVCLGNIWKGAEHTLLAHVILHVARLLNWDEKSEVSYGGWNPRAVHYWKTALGARPLQPVQYPELPLHLTHGRAGVAGGGGSHAYASAPDGRESVFRILTEAPQNSPQAGANEPTIVIK